MSEYPSDWNKRRKKVLKRDGYMCQNCGARGGPNGNADLHVHHIVPKSSGGSHKLSNLATECKECHNAIHNDTVKSSNQQTSSDNHRSALYDNIEYIIEFEEILALLFADYEEVRIPHKPPVAVLSILTVERESIIEELSKFEDKHSPPPEKLVNRYHVITDTIEALLHGTENGTNYGEMISDCFNLLNRSNTPPQEVQQLLLDTGGSYSDFLQKSKRYRTAYTDSHNTVAELLRQHYKNINSIHTILDEEMIVDKHDCPDVSIPDKKLWKINELKQENHQLMSDIGSELDSAVDQHNEYIKKEFITSDNSLYERLKNAKLHGSNVFRQNNIKQKHLDETSESKTKDANLEESKNKSDSKESNWVAIAVIIIFFLILIGILSA
jgi:hypothetical protein